MEDTEDGPFARLPVCRTPRSNKILTWRGKVGSGGARGVSLCKVATRLSADGSSPRILRGAWTTYIPASLNAASKLSLVSELDREVDFAQSHSRRL